MSLNNKLYIFLLAVWSVFSFQSCENSAGSKSVLPQKSISPQEIIPNKPKMKEQTREKQFSFNGVSFWYDQNIAEEIVARKVDPTVPNDITFRPDGIEPLHLSFRLTGSYAGQHADSSFQPEINVYPIAEYIKLFRGSKDYSSVLSAKFRSLKSIISEQPSVINGEYPYIPFVDATQILHSHLSYLSFKEGKGIGFLTQFNHADPVLVNNKDIVYVFQGITSDGKYLISAAFPIKASFLPDDPDAESYKGYVRPKNYFDREKLSLNEENYKKYLSNVKQELDSATDEQFAPNLADIRKLLSSLEINPEILKRSL
jgi:hypothetical protein